LEEKGSMIYRRFIKRILDFTISLISLIIFSPIFIVVVVLVRVKLGSPVFFCQKRPGKDEKIFTIYKFRTMTDKRDENGNLCSDDIRLTSFGRKLRATSLDELPQLLNVIKGDMAIVGPRPLMVEYLPYYTEEEKIRHTVRPGITGLAQVRGRNSISWEEKFSFDIQYVNKMSLMFDLKIIMETVSKVIKKSDIGQGEECPEYLNVLRKDKK
jgi:undecaprenyl-phosphate galactose phosphotransferase